MHIYEELTTLFENRFERNELSERLYENSTEREIALKIALEKKPYAWRAAWVLKEAMKPADPILIKHIDDILSVLPSLPDGQQRELMHLIEKVELNEDQEGVYFDICITLWESISKKPSVRYFAIKHLFQIIKKYPELIGEIQHLLDEEYLEPLTPGVRRGVEKMIDRL